MELFDGIWWVGRYPTQDELMRASDEARADVYVYEDESLDSPVVLVDPDDIPFDSTGDYVFYQPPDDERLIDLARQAGSFVWTPHSGSRYARVRATVGKYQEGKWYSPRGRVYDYDPRTPGRGKCSCPCKWCGGNCTYHDDEESACLSNPLRWRR